MVAKAGNIWWAGHVVTIPYKTVAKLVSARIAMSESVDQLENPRALSSSSD